MFTLGLGVPIFLVGPLSLLSGAWLATICAGWISNFARWGQSQSRLLAILGVSLVGAILALLPYWGAAWLINTLYRPPSVAPVGAIYFLPYVLGALAFTVTSSLAVWRLRIPAERGLTRDLGLTLLMLVTVPALIAGTIFAGCSLTYCGA